MGKQRKVENGGWRDDSAVRRMSFLGENMHSVPMTYVSGSHLLYLPAAGDAMPLASMDTCTHMLIPTQTHTFASLKVTTLFKGENI